MSRRLHKPILDTRGLIVPIKQGGTNADNVTDADIQLDIVTSVMINQPDGIAGLDIDGRLNSSVIPSGLVFDSNKLSGPTNLNPGEIGEWEITDYDQYKPYTISATSGFITRAKNKVYFRPPSTPGSYDFIINDKTITVTVANSYIQKPTIVSPIEDYDLATIQNNIYSDEFKVLGVSKFKSLRFKRNIGSALEQSKTNTVQDTSATTKTFSVQFKRGSFNTQQSIITNSIDSNNFWSVMFDSSNRLWLLAYQSGTIILNKLTTATFTDTNWHHLLISVDTTQAVAEDRLKLYIDNVRITSFSTNVNQTQNQASILKLAPASGIWYPRIGTIAVNTSSRFDGYMSEIYLIDGQALDPSYFGETDPNLNIWAPKQYTGTYGTNGFYLDFKDNATLFDLGRDKSYQGNNWTCNNISIASDSTYDVMEDNPISKYPIFDTTNTLLQYRSAGMEATTNIVGTGWYRTAVVNQLIPATGKWYWEFTERGSTTGDDAVFGLLSIDVAPNAYIYVGKGVGSYGLYIIRSAGGNAEWYSDGVLNGTMGTVLPELAGNVEGPAVGFAFDANNNTVEIFVNGASRGIRSIPSSQSGKLRPAVSLYAANTVFNGGQRPFSYTPPIGFKSLVTPILHDSTDWELSDDPAFSNIVSQSLANTVDINEWTINGLQVDKDYYLRTKYNSSQYGSSEWSDTRHFKTKDTLLPYLVESQIGPSDPESGGRFGVKICVSGDGNYLAVGSSLRDVTVVDAGKVYIYKRTGNTWVQDATIIESTRVTGDHFGSCVALNYDGTKLAVGADGQDVTVTDSGAIFIYNRSGSTWTLQTSVVAADRAASDYFGTSVSFDNAGTRMVVGARNKTIPSVATNGGKVYVYTYNGSAWVQEATLIASDESATIYFGIGVSISGDSTRIAVGAYNKTVNGISGAGKVYIFVRSGTTWTEESNIVASDPVSGDAFGFDVGFNNDATMLAIGARGKTVNGLSIAGEVYLYTRKSGITFNEEYNRIISPNVAASEAFASGVSFVSDGSMLCVGASLSNYNGVVSGSVYTFI